jgi:DNA-3-methyladenine glycosylase II
MSYTTVASPQLLIRAADHLAAHDLRLAPLIHLFGPAKLAPHTNYYQELVESIVGQQLSVKAAATINRRFVELFDNGFPTPQDILEKPTETLRLAGLSKAKANYVHDLAVHIADGRLSFESFEALSNQEIIARLTAVKGIGEWTAHMFLIFCMGRLDILPVRDLGIRTGIMRLYGLEQLPGTAEVQDVASTHHWHPYESVASWYVWASLDNKPI